MASVRRDVAVTMLVWTALSRAQSEGRSSAVEEMTVNQQPEEHIIIPTKYAQK